MADQNPEHPTHLDVDEARGAEAPGIVRYVLIASLFLIVVVFAAIWFLYQA